MGCLQLAYEPNLQIVHSHEAKSVQLWYSVDPLAEKMPSWSPYSYCFNNPIIWTDPTGMAPEPPKNGIPQFIDNTGVYFWRADKKAYEQYKYTDSSREHYSFSGYYSVNSNSKAVGKSVSIDNSKPIIN